MLSIHRYNLFGTPPLWRGFRHTKKTGLPEGKPADLRYGENIRISSFNNALTHDNERQAKGTTLALILGRFYPYR